MNKRLLHVALIAAMIVVPGCSDRLEMEDVVFSLAFGLDLDQDDNLIFYMISPVFSRNVEKKTQQFSVTAQTMREGRAKLEAYTPGVFQGRKVQVALVGKRLMEHEDWFRMLDPFFRDSKNSLTARVVAYNGPLSDLMYLNPKDEPMIPLLLRGMVDTKNARSETAKTTLQELDRQMYETGVTPSIAEVKLDPNKEVVLQGTALLDHSGKYAATLNTQESVLLQILQRNAKKPVSVTLPIYGEPKRGPFATDSISINGENIKTKVKTSFQNDRFQFHINVSMSVVLTEKLLSFDVEKQAQQLERKLAEQLQKQFERLVRKLQSNKIDPIGLGLYARAYEYKRYKEVKEQWGETFAAANIKLAVKIKIQSMGPMR